MHESENSFLDEAIKLGASSSFVKLVVVALLKYGFPREDDVVVEVE